MDDTHEGGCHCGAVRYRTTGQPHTAGVCHCRYCQTRTGSAFGISVYFDADRVEILSGRLTDYSFTTESGRSFTTRFCPICGTTLFWQIELFDDAIAVAGGTFDPPSFWYDIDRDIFTRTKAGFVRLDTSESHDTAPSHAPVTPDRTHLKGG